MKEARGLKDLTIHDRTITARGPNWGPCKEWPRSELLLSLGALLAPESQERDL